MLCCFRTLARGMGTEYKGGPELPVSGMRSLCGDVAAKKARGEVSPQAARRCALRRLTTSPHSLR
jgi:hypothetical protein